MVQLLALAVCAVDGEKGAFKQWFQTVALKGLVLVQAHPVYSGIAAGVTGMLVVFFLRKAVWATLKWVLGIPFAALKQVARPVVAAYQAFRYRKAGAVPVRGRLPIIGMTAYVGPCGTCGSKVERRIKTTAYYGGQLRGIDTMTGAAAMGCAQCVKC